MLDFHESHAKSVEWNKEVTERVRGLQCDRARVMCTLHGELENSALR